MNQLSKVLLIGNALISAYLTTTFNGFPELSLRGFTTLIGSTIGIGLFSIGPAFLYAGLAYLVSKKFENNGFSIGIISGCLICSYIVISANGT